MRNHTLRLIFAVATPERPADKVLIRRMREMESRKKPRSISSQCRFLCGSVEALGIAAGQRLFGRKIALLVRGNSVNFLPSVVNCHRYLLAHS